MRSSNHIRLFLLLITGVFCHLVNAQVVIDLEDGDTISVSHFGVEQNISLDGQLSESVWTNLPAYDEFVVVDPDTLRDVPHKTLVKFFYTEKGFYVGVKYQYCHWVAILPSLLAEYYIEV